MHSTSDTKIRQTLDLHEVYAPIPSTQTQTHTCAFHMCIWFRKVPMTDAHVPYVHIAYVHTNYVHGHLYISPLFIRLFRKRSGPERIVGMRGLGRNQKGRRWDLNDKKRPWRQKKIRHSLAQLISRPIMTCFNICRSKKCESSEDTMICKMQNKVCAVPDEIRIRNNMLNMRAHACNNMTKDTMQGEAWQTSSFT